MTLLVLDASASVDLLLDTATGRALQPRLPVGEWWVPQHFFVEVSAGIRRAEQRGEIPTAKAMVAFAELTSTPMQPVSITPLLAEAWARRGHLTIADALYVILAEHLGATLVTTDEKLAKSPGLSVATITANHG